MPISREEFDARRVNLTVPIRWILENNPELAFTAEEVQQRLIDRLNRTATVIETVVALDNLVQRGTVDVALIAGERRYIIRFNVGSGPTGG